MSDTSLERNSALVTSLGPLTNTLDARQFRSSEPYQPRVHEPVSLRLSDRFESVSFGVVPHDSTIAGWHLKSVLAAEIRTTVEAGSLATVQLEGIAEYGTGADPIDAIEDLVDSLGEYREVLEGREDRIGESALADLTRLRKLIERASDS